MTILRRQPLFGNFAWALLLAASGLIGAKGAFAQVAPPVPATATASTSPVFQIEVTPAETTIGEPVKVFLHSNNPAISSNEIQNVKFEPSDDWEVQGDWTRDWQPGADGKPGLWHATLRPFKTGNLRLPSTLVTFEPAPGHPDQQTLSSATLTVRSTIPENSQATVLIPLRDIAQAPRDWEWLQWLIGGLILGGLILYLALWWKRRPKKSLVPAEPPLPPGLWALRELERRSRLPVCQQGPAKTIYSMVSEVMRLYLGRRYGIDAIDMTSRECLDALAAVGVNGTVREWMRLFFDECDFVKFSNFDVPRERWGTIWNDAKLIVQNTTPAEELSPDSASGQAAPPSPPMRPTPIASAVDAPPEAAS